MLRKCKERLFGCLKYGEREDNINLINFPSDKEVDTLDERYYVYADFIKPGKHKYFVNYKANNKIQITEPYIFCA